MSEERYEHTILHSPGPVAGFPGASHGPGPVVLDWQERRVIPLDEWQAEQDRIAQAAKLAEWKKTIEVEQTSEHKEAE